MSYSVFALILSSIVAVMASEEYYIRSNGATTHVFQDRLSSVSRPVIQLRSRYVAAPTYSSAVYTVPATSRAYYPARAQYSYPFYSSPRAYYSSPMAYAPSYGWGQYGGWGNQGLYWGSPIGYRMNDYFLKK